MHHLVCHFYLNSQLELLFKNAARLEEYDQFLPDYLESKKVCEIEEQSVYFFKTKFGKWIKNMTVLANINFLTKEISLNQIKGRLLLDNQNKIDDVLINYALWKFSPLRTGKTKVTAHFYYHLSMPLLIRFFMEVVALPVLIKKGMKQNLLAMSLEHGKKY
jgi:ribosome-associated toxin RatA of RatAB toxin-antitoxin module